MRNNAENGIDNALVNELKQLRKDFDDFRGNPLGIGNGSLNWAVFPAFTIGPASISAGATTYFSALYMDHSLPFTYDGRPAINRRTTMDFLMSLFVDALDSDHVLPYGSSLSAGQKNVEINWWYDLAGSELSETSGQRLIIIRVKNLDSSSHNYYVQGAALIPRPALKPQ